MTQTSNNNTTLIREIKPANRLNSVSEYYFSAKLREIAAMNAAGKNVLNLGIGNPDLPPSAATIETLCHEAQKPDTHGYQSYVGIPELRNGFAQWYKKWYGVELNPDSEIQPLIGSKEGILHITLAFVNPGDGVLVPNPGYPTYQSASRLAEADVITYDLLEENNWLPDFEALEKLDLSNVKLMWTNYPNMPTGTNASPKLFEKLVAFGKKHGIVICNDNPYSFILNDKKMSILSIEGAKDNCIELNSMSKSHNMAGWRMAMLASNARFIKWVLHVKSNVDSGMFRPMMVAAVQALNNSDEWHAEVNKVYASRRELAYKILDILECNTIKTKWECLFGLKYPTNGKTRVKLPIKFFMKKCICNTGIYFWKQRWKTLKNFALQPGEYAERGDKTPAS